MRGVNKLIVEIKDTENEYFDRAILFLKPDKVMTDQAELNRGAQELLAAVKHGEKRRRKGAAVGLAIGGTVLITAVIVLLAVLL